MAIVQGYKFPWRPGNHFSVLVDSTEFLPRMLGAIDAARHYLFLEMYLMESGVIADRFIDTLVQAAERGVQVYLLFDDYGARLLNRVTANAWITTIFAACISTRCNHTASCLISTEFSGNASTWVCIETIASYCLSMAGLLLPGVPASPTRLIRRRLPNCAGVRT
jgi:hypothetical protein